MPVLKAPKTKYFKPASNEKPFSLSLAANTYKGIDNISNPKNMVSKCVNENKMIAPHKLNKTNG